MKGKINNVLRSIIGIAIAIVFLNSTAFALEAEPTSETASITQEVSAGKIAKGFIASCLNNAIVEMFERANTYINYDADVYELIPTDKSATTATPNIEDASQDNTTSEEESFNSGNFDDEEAGNAENVKGEETTDNSNIENDSQDNTANEEENISSGNPDGEKAEDGEEAGNAENVKSEETTGTPIEVQTSVQEYRYYEQLTELEKRIYDGFVNNSESLMDNKAVEFLIDNYNISELDIEFYKNGAIRARRAYVADHPDEKIWVDNCKYQLSHQNGSMGIRLTPQEQINVRSESKVFETKVSELVKELKGTDAEKLQQIHDWLIDNVTYDINAQNSGNAYGAIVGGQAVCSGYAYSFKHIADQAGLNTIYVQGKFHIGGNAFSEHAWNMAYVNEQWLLVDVTFDRSLKNKYLFISPDRENHQPDDRFVYPF